MRRGSTGTIPTRRAKDGDDDGDGPFAAAPVDILPKEIDLAGEADEKLANTLVVTVIQARNLQTAALRTTLSCYVKVSSLGREYKTSVISKSDEPFWNETFSFRAVDWAASVTLSVRDKINVKMRFLGQVRISCTDLAALPGMATQSWFRLRDKNWERKPGMDSELELKVALVYTKKNDPGIIKDFASIAAADMDDEVVGVVADQDDETEEEAFERRHELERLENERKNTMYANLRQGDYQVQIHVIEARDLKGENLSGTSDPYVQAEVMGLKKKTSTKYETLGCVFDEILFFHFKSIGRNELRRASIKLSIYDKETVLKDNLIGTYQLDCLSVYFRPHHELYRQWVAIHDHLNEKDRGIQGFLLVSVTVIGPGDTFHIHDREAEIAQELATAAAAAARLAESGGGASASANASAATLAALNPEGQSLVLLPPTIELKLHFLVIKVFKAEDLPAMDEGGLIMASGIDAFVQVGFGANAACRSSVVTVKGSSHLTPEFLEELWIPVMAPTLCRHISISVWDRDLGRKDELVGITSHDYLRVVSAELPGGILAKPSTVSAAEARQKRELEASESLDEKGSSDTEDEVQLRWFNLYGPPLKRVNKKRGALIAQNPDLGSTYRGRVLLSMERVEAPPPEEGEKFHAKRMKNVTLAAIEPRLPRTLKYVLRCAIFCGAELPLFSSALTGPSAYNTKLRVVVSIGSYELPFETLTVGKDGRINWEECKEKWPIILPADLTQLPDIIVTLSRQVEKDVFVSVSFARFSAAEYYQQAFSGKCQWVHLSEEVTRRQTRYAMEKTQSPGSLLLRLGFGREEVAVRSPWGDEASQFSSFRHHRTYREFRVHVFQFRNLMLPETKIKPPSPFISVRCCGQVRKTETKFKTLDPLFYETLVFTGLVPHEVAYSPDLVFHVHDANVSSSLSTNIPGAILGELRIPMTKAQRAVANASPARPAWYTLSLRSSGSDADTSLLSTEEPHGDALISIQYVDHQGPIQTLFAQDPKALIPEYEEANLEIIALGVRKLKSRSLLGIRNPMVEFELTGAVFADGTSVRSTRPAGSGTGRNGKNANLLERLVVPAKLPVDTLYAPQLSIRVLEVTMGGLRKTPIASCVVDLKNKIPWSASFVPQYQQPPFENPNTATAVGTTGGDAADKTKRRKSLLDVLGISRLGRKSQGALQSVDPIDDPLAGENIGALSDEEFQAEEAVEAAPVAEPDDGIGVGDLPRSVQPALWTLPPEMISEDPAVRDQLAREERCRYLAGHTDLVRGGTTGGASVYQLPVGMKAGEAPPGSQEELTSAGTGSLSYLTGRDWWISQGGEELEHYLKDKALETYPLYRSVLARPSLLKRKRLRVKVKAGVFKGVISVAEKHKKMSAAKVSNAVDLDRLKDPQAVIVRVYVLRGCNLQAKDLNGFSDPYLRIKLGKDIQSDRAHHKRKTLNPEFFKMFTFNTTLPGASQLEIGVWDHDLLTSDDFIGSTTIDLEDRWFHRDWQRLAGPGASPQSVGLPMKPIENRHLYTPKRTTSQGLLQVWVDILTAQQAALLPPTNIEPPAPKKFEVRVIVWRAENVTDKDESEINDYFVKVWIEGGKAENTDVHWRCSNGKPCWNWRFKLSAEYPLRTAEFARLHIQLWDKDVVKWNDVIGEAQLDLYKWLRRAYETNRSVSPFLELKNLSKHREAAVQNEDDKGAPSPNQKEPDNEDEGEEASDDEDEDDDVERGYGTKENATLLQRNHGKGNNGKMQLKVGTKKPLFMDKEAQKRSKDAKRKTKQARDSNEARLALNGLLDFVGMGSLPDEAEWVTIYYTDRESAISMDMGRLGISVEIVPEKEAQINPVGKGQEAPNVNPYLPPPVGRMRLTANPFMMLKELVGPKMCLRIALACCCVGCVMFIGVFGATIMSSLTFIEMIGREDEPGGAAFTLPDWPYSFNTTANSNGSLAKPTKTTAFSPAEESTGSNEDERD